MIPVAHRRSGGPCVRPLRLLEEPRRGDELGQPLRSLRRQPGGIDLDALTRPRETGETSRAPERYAHAPPSAANVANTANAPDTAKASNIANPAIAANNANPATIANAANAANAPGTAPIANAANPARAAKTAGYLFPAVGGFRTVPT
ncbi:MAG: hypothetical protein M3O15_02635, partial [Acidobacteriota bacterium]|nr:hypothetical protein [Acidobacteriota bacterium]